MAGVTWHGMDRLQAAFAAMPMTVEREAAAILNEAAQAALTAIAAAYPYKKGGLRRGLRLKPPRRGIGTHLVQRAPHGWLYEHGSKRRATQAGANRGRMPATPTFEPIADRYRRMAQFDIIDRLYAHGATRVTGDAEE